MWRAASPLTSKLGGPLPVGSCSCAPQLTAGWCFSLLYACRVATDPVNPTIRIPKEVRVCVSTDSCWLGASRNRAADALVLAYGLQGVPEKDAYMDEELYSPGVPEVECNDT